MQNQTSVLSVTWNDNSVTTSQGMVTRNKLSHMKNLAVLDILSKTLFFFLPKCLSSPHPLVGTSTVPVF